MTLTRDGIAYCVARDLPAGSYVNLGVGIPVLVAGYLDPRKEIFLHSENGILGVGPKAAAKLEAMGIRTIGELARADPVLLVERFGEKHGAWMHEAANGRDERPVVTHSEPKSISRETTFEDDLHPVDDRETLSRVFTDLCSRLAGDLERKGYAGRTIGLKLRYDNFKTLTRDCTLEAPTRDAAAIRRAAGECLKRVPLERRIRLLGVRVGTLTRQPREA